MDSYINIGEIDKVCLDVNNLIVTDLIREQYQKFPLSDSEYLALEPKQQMMHLLAMTVINLKLYKKQLSYGISVNYSDENYHNVRFEDCLNQEVFEYHSPKNHLTEKLLINLNLINENKQARYGISLCELNLHTPINKHERALLEFVSLDGQSHKISGYIGITYERFQMSRQDIELYMEMFL